MGFYDAPAATPEELEAIERAEVEREVRRLRRLYPNVTIGTRVQATEAQVRRMMRQSHGVCG